MYDLLSQSIDNVWQSSYLEVNTYQVRVKQITIAVQVQFMGAVHKMCRSKQHKSDKKHSQRVASGYLEDALLAR